jgi:hypothetical protein
MRVMRNVNLTFTENINYFKYFLLATRLREYITTIYMADNGH